MPDLTDPLTLLASLGGTSLTVMLVLQWIKQFGWFKNTWCRILAPILGIALALGDLLVRRHLGVDLISSADLAVVVYNALVGGFNAGMLAVLGYDLQKRGPLVILPAGPDNHPADRATAQLAEKES